MSIPVNMYRVCVNKHFFFSLISFFLFELAIVTLLSLVERMSRIQKWWYHTHCGCKQCINILWWWYPHYGSLLRYFCIIGTLVSHKKKKTYYIHYISLRELLPHHPGQAVAFVLISAWFYYPKRG